MTVNIMTTEKQERLFLNVTGITTSFTPVDDKVRRYIHITQAPNIRIDIDFDKVKTIEVHDTKCTWIKLEHRYQCPYCWNTIAISSMKKAFDYCPNCGREL